MNTSLQCIQPSEITEGDLMAFVDGIADPRVAQHIRACAFCTARAAEWAQLNRSLVAKLYRISCPAPQTLGDFFLNVLPAGEKLAVAKHLRVCPLCRKELAGYADDEPAAPLLGAWRTAGRAILRVVDALRSAPQLEMQGLRGAAGRRQEYRVGDGELVIGYQPASELIGMLAGVFVPWPRAELPADETIQVQLFREGMLVATQATNSLGQFVFDDVIPGRYDMLLDLQNDLVLIAEIAVS